MKKYINIITALAILIFSASCEEVIDLELNDTEPKLVIEGSITNNTGPYPIYISKTGNYFEPGQFLPVTDALVIISNDKGIADTCTEIEPGVYYTNNLQGQTSTNYQLYVNAEGKEYTASSYMPEKIELTSLEYMFTKALSPEGDDGYIIKCQFMDPAIEKNYYRIKTYLNGDFFNEAGNELVLWNDVLFDGDNADIPSKRGGDMFQVNDTVEIELLSINQHLYQYYTSLNNALASGSGGMESFGKSMIIGSAAPANPPTNITGGALGYFATYAVSKHKTIIID